MSEILSQEEIDALLRGDVETMQNEEDSLTPDEIDALGEIGNISMGTAATTLFTLLNHKVTITTPEVDVITLSELAMQYPLPFVAVEIQYTEGLQGRNLLIINEEDVKIITDLMMGGDGTNIGGDLSELHLSAIGEVMNQMIGSSSTSLATMFHNSINISPPKAFIINFATGNTSDLFESDEPIVRINFKMEISDILDSYIMQLIPVKFAKDMVENLLNAQSADDGQEEETTEPVQSAQQSKQENTVSTIGKENASMVPNNENLSDYEQTLSNLRGISESSWTKPVDVRPVHFQPLEEAEAQGDRSNIDLILDVPLEVSVELGETKRTIKEILELSEGSIIELNKMAGEPVDILVNGKMIAKGEVVVIDDNFGVRIIDIVSPVKRLTQLK